MVTSIARPRRARIYGLAAMFALVGMLLPAAAGIALGHHATVVPNLDCSGNVTYQINDWTTVDTGHQAEATFKVYYALNGSSSYTLSGPGSFTLAGGWTFSGSFSVSPSVTSVAIRATDFVWGDGSNDPGPYDATATRPTNCKKSPTIATTLSGSTVPIGTAVYDSATLSGASPNAGGTVTYTVYTNSTCTAGAQSAGTVTVTDGVVPNSNAITFNSSGTWYWQAVYSGDANNNGATSACTSEVLTVVGCWCPTIATTLSGSTVPIGTAVYDSATLSGGYNPTGTIYYRLYSDSSCQSLVANLTPTFNALVAGVAPNSNGYTFNSPGTWYWQAVYSGDANNSGATSACTSEVLTVSPTPTPTPYQSFQGATATPGHITTPPPTSTGSNGSNNSNDPASLLVLLICLEFGGIGLLAIQVQRRRTMGG
jgi:hypothetical protein